MPGITYNSGVRYNTGVRYNETVTTTPNHSKPMAKVKFNPRPLTSQELNTFATTHKNNMATPSVAADFPSPMPDVATFNASLAAYDTKLHEISQAEDALDTLRKQRDALRTALEEHLGTRAGYVQTQSGGDEAKIVSTGFDLQSDRVPTSEMPKPTNLTATIGKKEGEIILKCDGVPKAKTYFWECRTHDDGAAPGTWTLVKISNASKITVTGLISGKKYAFRVRVFGPNDLESPWSDEAVEMAR